jgi:hypothetical protein
MAAMSADQVNGSSIIDLALTPPKGCDGEFKYNIRVSHQ